MGRKPCCDKEGVNRGTWSVMEDQILANFIKVHGEGKWRDVPRRAGLNRCGKSCRLRWLNYLRPDIKRGNFSEDEEDLIIRLHNLLGNRWSLIAGRLPGRTDNEIKNFWNTNLSKRVHQMNYPQSIINKPSHNNPIIKTPTTLTSAHHHHHHQHNTKTSSSFNLSCPADPSSQPNNPVIRAKPVRCTKKIILPESNAAEWETQNNPSASACDDTARDLRADDCMASYGFLEDFDVDGLMLMPEMPQVAPENNNSSSSNNNNNNIDDKEVNEFEYCDADNYEANLSHQNTWMVGQLFGSSSADHHDEDVDFSSLNLFSDSFMDLDPSYI